MSVQDEYDLETMGLRPVLKPKIVVLLFISPWSCFHTLRFACLKIKWLCTTWNLLAKLEKMQWF